MPTEPLDHLPLWALFAVMVLILIAVIETGYRLGRWRHARSVDEKEQPVGGMVASILGLVALVLGFTFGLAASRFDARRLTVLEEANAIGTCFLRAGLLPQPERTNAQQLLKEYTDVRLDAVRPEGLEKAIKRSEELHVSLWKLAQSAAQQDDHSIMTGLFVQSLNAVIDVHAKRVLVGVRSRIPLVIWAGVFGLSCIGMLAVGYQAGLAATRRTPAMSALAVTFALVLLLIADLDRGQEGLLRVGQQAMVDLQHSLNESAP